MADSRPHARCAAWRPARGTEQCRRCCGAAISGWQPGRGGGAMIHRDDVLIKASPTHLRAVRSKPGKASASPAGLSLRGRRTSTSGRHHRLQADRDCGLRTSNPDTGIHAVNGGQATPQDRGGCDTYSCQVFNPHCLKRIGSKITKKQDPADSERDLAGVPTVVLRGGVVSAPCTRSISVAARRSMLGRGVLISVVLAALVAAVAPSAALGGRFRPSPTSSTSVPRWGRRIR